eukprot:Em0019g1063a
MHLFSTWEVRDVPPNCVSRLCTVTVTRVEILRPMEPGLTSVVLAASMKTPHRSLRSNEIEVSPDGTLDVQMEVTFSLQYPHFLKRGGNLLQIKLQRRKRYGQRPIGGYKTLAVGEITMAHVLQHSFQGAVYLYAEKVKEHIAVVTVGSLISSTNVDRLSSDEEEDEIFSDVELRASDSDSGGENDHSAFGARRRAEQKAKENKGISNAVLSRLLKLRHPTKRPTEELPEELPEVVLEDRVSAVTFVSSISDSEEEEEVVEDTAIGSPVRPTLSPFFGSDRMSVVSLPTGSYEPRTEGPRSKPLREPSGLTKRYGSLEEAVGGSSVNLAELPVVESVFKDCDLERGRVWVVAAGAASTKPLHSFLEGLHESVVSLPGKEDVVYMQSFLQFVEKQHSSSPVHIILVGEDLVVSSLLQALVSVSTPDLLKFTYLPTLSGTIAMRMSSLDDLYQSMCAKWVESYGEDSGVLEYIENTKRVVPMPIGQVVLHRSPTGEQGASTEIITIPLICSASVGTLDAAETDLQTSPISPNSSSNSDSLELALEYWVAKTSSKQTDKVNIKVRSVLVSLTGQGLTVTASKKAKGIKIRKKDSEPASVVSFTTAQLVCKPASKHDPPITVVVDGVEWHGISTLRMLSTWEQAPGRCFPVAMSGSAT